MVQLTRLVNSLHPLQISLLLTKTPPSPSPFANLQTLTSAASRAAFSSSAPGGHPIDPALPAERKILPEELSRNVVVLTCDSADGLPCHVYMVGTVHVSQESCEEVRNVINLVKPQVVFLELCASRTALLTAKNFKVPTTRQMIDSWKKKRNLFGIVYSWFLAKLANELKVMPGSEFRVGYEEAKQLGSKVILGDRPVNVTLQRTWRNMPFWHKTKLLYTFFCFCSSQGLEETVNKFSAKKGVTHARLREVLKDLDDKDILAQLINEMSKTFPTLMTTLIDERDQYMASTLLGVARSHHTVVAVVGRGHLKGIKKHWLQPIDVEKLMEIPPKRNKFKSLGVTGLGLAIATAIYRAAKK